jgi:hypothetical protein
MRTPEDVARECHARLSELGLYDLSGAGPTPEQIEATIADAIRDYLAEWGSTMLTNPEEPDRLWLDVGTESMVKWVRRLKDRLTE